MDGWKCICFWWTSNSPDPGAKHEILLACISLRVRLAASLVRHLKLYNRGTEGDISLAGRQFIECCSRSNIQVDCERQQLLYTRSGVRREFHLACICYLP